MAAGRLRSGVLVEEDHGLVAVAELCLRGLVAVDAKAEGSLIPRDGAVDVGNGQMDRSEAKPRRQRRRGPRIRFCFYEAHRHSVDGRASASSTSREPSWPEAPK